MASAQQKSKEMDPLTQERSSKEGPGEIQEGISEEEACGWALMDRLNGGLSRWEGGGHLKPRVWHLPTLFFIPSFLACRKYQPCANPCDKLITEEVESLSRPMTIED